MIIFSLIIIVIVFILWRREIKRRRRWFHHAIWHELVTGSPMCRHRCGVCDKWLSDVGGGYFQDYDCPCGNYEFHFDCGHFRCRVGYQLFEFRDNSLTEKRNGLVEIKAACQAFKEQL